MGKIQWLLLMNLSGARDKSTLGSDAQEMHIFCFFSMNNARSHLEHDPPCVRSKRLRVYRHHAHMCLNMCAWCRHTRGRFERTHGGVLNLHTGVTQRHTQKQTHAQTHRHTENTPHAGHTQDKKQRFSDNKSSFFFDAPENVICTKSLFPNVRRRSTRAGARRRCAMDAHCGLKKPVEPLTKSFTAD